MANPSTYQRGSGNRISTHHAMGHFAPGEGTVPTPSVDISSIHPPLRQARAVAWANRICTTIAAWLHSCQAADASRHGHQQSVTANEAQALSHGRPEGDGFLRMGFSLSGTPAQKIDADINNRQASASSARGRARHFDQRHPAAPGTRSPPPPRVASAFLGHAPRPSARGGTICVSTICAAWLAGGPYFTGADQEHRRSTASASTASPNHPCHRHGSATASAIDNSPTTYTWPVSGPDRATLPVGSENKHERQRFPSPSADPSASERRASARPPVQRPAPAESTWTAEGRYQNRRSTAAGRSASRSRSVGARVKRFSHRSG